MKTVLQLLQTKPAGVYSVTPTASVYDAIKLFSDKGIGAALVMEDDRLLGIVSERDYARKVILRGKSSHETRVSEIMSSPVVTIGLHQTNEECMQTMTDQRIRHLPVVEDGKVVGVLSIGDLVKDMIAEQRELIAQLENYIMGNG